MKVDLDELRVEVEAELHGMEQRRLLLVKRLEQIKAVQEIVEESMGGNGEFRIQKALERMSTRPDGPSAKDSEEAEEDEPKIRLAVLGG